MKRRELLKRAALLPVLANSVMSENRRSSANSKKIIKPKRLSKGDTIGLISPSSSLSPEAFDRAARNLETLGFRVKIGKNARNVKNFLAGTDKERLDDLHWAFNDSTIKAVWCARGGYGVSRILNGVDYRLIKKNPKIFIGYSDVTALLLAIYENTGLVTFHGPVASSAFSDYTKTHALEVLTNPAAPYRIELSEYNQSLESNLYKTAVIMPGKCRGKLVGGNLSLLAALAGTRFALRNVEDKILFIEDIGEPPYKIDRMLTQLRETVDLRALNGVALGVFADRKSSENDDAPSLIEVFRDRLGDLGVPVIYGLSFGHIRDQFTLPYGIEAELDTAKATLTLMEAAVT